MFWDAGTAGSTATAGVFTDCGAESPPRSQCRGRVGLHEGGSGPWRPRGTLLPSTTGGLFTAPDESLHCRLRVGYDGSGAPGCGWTEGHVRHHRGLDSLTADVALGRHHMCLNTEKRSALIFCGCREGLAPSPFLDLGWLTWGRRGSPAPSADGLPHLTLLQGSRVRSEAPCPRTCSWVC